MIKQARLVSLIKEVELTMGEGQALPIIVIADYWFALG